MGKYEKQKFMSIWDFTEGSATHRNALMTFTWAATLRLGNTTILFIFCFYIFFHSFFACFPIYFFLFIPPATHESNGLHIITALILSDINPLAKTRMDLVLELKNNASKLLLAIMESRADSENAERILQSMHIDQLVSLAIIYLYIYI